MMSFHHALVLLICAHLVTSAPIVAKRGSKALDEIAVLFNTVRVMHAEKENIGNMHELTYDHELEKVAKSMTKDCKFPHGPYILVSGESNPETNNEKLTHPLQTKIACVEEAKCPNRGIEHQFCLIGPYNFQSISDAKTGPLGSHCDNGLADNGLCKAGSGKIAPAYGFERELRMVNDLRVQIAKEKNIGNMHELTIDLELDKVGQSMISDCKFRSGPYVFVDAKDFIKEILVPTQTKFACVDLVAPCPDRSIMKGICLFGPRDVSTRDEGAKYGPLGSHCDHGVADNGLCKAGKGSVVVSNSIAQTSIKELNDFRALIAKHGQIGNMHEMTVDPELEKIAHSMEADCKFPTGPYVLVSDNNNSNAAEEFDREPFFHPLQTKVFCVEMVAPCPGRADSFCLVGPHTSPATEKDKKTGPLGSHCKNGVANNGLCKAK